MGNSQNIHDYVFTLENVPMDESEGSCQNPCQFDPFRVGIDLFKNSRFYIMFSSSENMAKTGPTIFCSLRQDLIIVDRDTGRRLKIDLAVFDSVPQHHWEEDEEP